MSASGEVNAKLEAVLRLRLRGPTGDVVEVEAVIDTGYGGSLNVPASVAAALGLVRRSDGWAILADGSSSPFDVYQAELEWGPKWRTAVVGTLGDESLVGMQLLAGHEVTIEAVPGGGVTVRSLL